MARRHRIALRRTQAEEDAKRSSAPVIVSETGAAYPDDLSRAQLQAAAKAAGIAANQSNDALKEALKNAE